MVIEFGINLEGKERAIVERMIELGIASSPAEAIEIALLDYNQRHRIATK